MAKVILTQARIKEEMDAYNADEVGIDNPINMDDAEVMLLNSDEFHGKDVEVEEVKAWDLLITLEFGNRVHAPTKAEAIKILKTQFKQDHNIDLKNSEIGDLI
jgi:hypothetical protein